MTTSRSDELFEREVSRREALTIAGGAVLAGTAFSAGGARAAAAAAQRGGTFRLGVLGAGAKDIIDGQNALAGLGDIARLVAGWETLTAFDRQGQIKPQLAAEVTARNPREWVVKLRRGVEFHNGKTMTADDVVYSLRRATDPKAGRTGGSALGSVDRAGIKKLDRYTVSIRLKQPDSTITAALAQYPCGIVPAGYDSREGKGASVKQGQIGTNAYMLESFTPGRQSVHTRFRNYWNDAEPGQVDKVVIVDIDDAAARVNALLSGQVDAIVDVPLAQVKTVSAAGMKILNSRGGAWSTITMRIDAPPFDDVRVRQAMRLIVDRPAMLQQAISGFGYVGNDMYAPLDPCYPKNVPQRKQDIERAKALLAAAGKSGLTVDLVTTDGPGTIEMAKVFAEQAKAADVTVNVKVLDSSTFFGDQYTKYPFAVDYWNTRGYLQQLGQGSLPTAPFNETHWPPAGSKFLTYYRQALAATDEKKKCAIVRKMYALEFTQGGYIIPFFRNLVDAYSPKVGGLKQGVGMLNLDYFGRGFRSVTIA
ncbi:MAG: ABC transporter substrate-binding protein [Gaiellales bacterium]